MRGSRPESLWGATIIAIAVIVWGYIQTRDLIRTGEFHYFQPY
jgi:hypothetical protein